MANELFQLMDKTNVSLLANQLIAKSNIRIGQRIVTEVTENSTNKQLASARNLYKLVSALQAKDAEITGRLNANNDKLNNDDESITRFTEEQVTQDGKLSDIESGLTDITEVVNSLTHLNLQTVTGTIDTITEPAYDVLYLQRDSEEDKTWNMYIYTDNLGWINIGDTEIDLSHIWSKDEVEEMREALNVHETEPISDDDLTAIVEEAFTGNVIDYRMEPVGEPEIPASVEYGTKLSDIEIKGTMMYDDVEVPGTFSFTTTDEEFAAMMEAEEDEPV